MYSTKIYQSWKQKQLEKYKQLIPKIKKYLNNTTSPSNKKTILDIGTGQAWFYEELQKQGISFKKITAIEPDKEMMKKENEKKLNLKYYNENFEKWSEKNKQTKFNLIILFDSIHLIKKTEEIQKHAKQDTLILISTPAHYKNLLKQFLNNKQYKTIKKGTIGQEEIDYFILIQKQEKSN